ncbi:MAG: glycosyltransferase family 4 protein, partial [Vulcanisaeta sp.]
LLDVLKFLRNLSDFSYAYIRSDELIKSLELIDKYDVIVALSLNEILPVLPLLSMRAPVIIDVHSPDWLWYFREKVYGIRVKPETIMKRMYIKMLGKSLYCRLLNSFDYNTWGRNCRKAFLIPNFVDTNMFKPVNEKYREFTILVRYDPSFKGGFDIFLRALRYLGGSLWLNVAIIGRNVPKEVITYVRRYVNNVYALGRVPRREELAQIYSRAHATVIPSRFEGFPLTALESLSCGTPIIMSDLPPTEWFLRDMSNFSVGTGLRFRPDDPRDLANKIRLMYNIWRYEEHAYLGSIQLSRRVAEFYDMRRVVPLYIEMIRRVAYGGYVN